MKKRIRIVMTIATICLALTMLTFGVYASTSVNFSVTGSVSFVVSNLFIDIDAGVTGGNLQSEATYDFDSVLAEGNPNNVSTPLEWKGTTTNGNGVAVSGSIANLNFLTTQAGKTIVFTFKFTNKGPSTVTGTISTTYPTTYVTQNISYSSGTSISIASAANQTVTIRYSLKSFGYTLTNQPLVITFDFQG